jgi:hypothetical protein
MNTKQAYEKWILSGILKGKNNCDLLDPCNPVILETGN